MRARRRVLVPGGTGTVGRGVVRAYLESGAAVAVPTRSGDRGAALRAELEAVGPGVLETVVGDYSTFEDASAVVDEVMRRLGGVDDVVAPVGDLWSGGRLTGITAEDWDSAFAVLARTHMAIARAALPRLGRGGAYSVVVGRSAQVPVPGLGLVSMEQASVLMMQRVLAAEYGDERRVFALVLGQVVGAHDAPEGLRADDVGAVAVALAASEEGSSTFELPDHAAAVELLDRLGGRAA